MSLQGGESGKTLDMVTKNSQGWMDREAPVTAEMRARANNGISINEQSEHSRNKKRGSELQSHR